MRVPEGRRDTEYKNIFRYEPGFCSDLKEDVYGYHIIKEGRELKCTEFKSAKEAAISLDKKLITLGYNPINVLKKL